MEDLTRAGYGLHPARALTWRRFWYAWLHLYLERARERREDRMYQIYVACLQHAPKQAGPLLAQMQAGNTRADRNMLLALNANLPRSVRPLLGLRNAAENVDKVRTALDWWDRHIEVLPPGSRQRAFVEAGKSAAEERYRRVH